METKSRLISLIFLLYTYTFFPQSVYELNQTKLTKLIESYWFCQSIDSITFSNSLEALMHEAVFSNSYDQVLDSIILMKSTVKIRNGYEKVLEVKDPVSFRVLIESIRNGNDKIDDLLSYLNEIEIPDYKTIQRLFILLNYNYRNSHQLENCETDILLRYIYLQDQLYRIACYKYKIISYHAVIVNDRILKDIFIDQVMNEVKYEMFSNTYYQITFDLLLIHSVSDHESCFFENYFCVYSQGYNNDFNQYENLRLLIDIYLKFKYEKQFFDTPYGEGKLTNHKWGKLPKINDENLKSLLKYLRILNPIL